MMGKPRRRDQEKKGEGKGKERGRKGSCWLLGMGGMVKGRGRKGEGKGKEKEKGKEWRCQWKLRLPLKWSTV